MKTTIAILSVFVFGISAYAQHSDQIKFKGKWSSPGGMDSNKMYFTMDDKYKWNGNYHFRISKLNGEFVFMLWSFDQIRTDSIQIVITNLTKDTFQLKSIMHYYTDGRPPESELLEGQTYILRSQKNS